MGEWRGRETLRVEMERPSLWERNDLGFLTSSLIYIYSHVCDIGLVGLVLFLDGLSGPPFNRSGPCNVTVTVNVLTRRLHYNSRLG